MGFILSLIEFIALVRPYRQTKVEVEEVERKQSTICVFMRLSELEIREFADRNRCSDSFQHVTSN